MTRLLLSGLLALLATLSHGQVVPDSLRGSLELQAEIDSITNNTSSLPDTLRQTFAKVDSIRSEFNTKADSLQSQYRKTVGDIDGQVNKLNHKIDSLQRFDPKANKHIKKYERSLQKLSDLRQKTESNFTEKLNALKAKTTDRLNALDLPEEYKQPLQSLTQQVDKVNLNTPGIKLPQAKLPGYDLPNIGNAPNLPSLNGVNGADLPQLPGTQLPNGVGDIAGQVSGVQENVGDVAGSATVPTNADQLQQTVESQATQIDGIDELNKQSGIIDGHKAQLDELADPAKAKEKATTMAKKAAVNHFAGKEEQLKAAMEKVAKYKQKYSSVSSIKDLPKRPPNPMKGKPLVERLVPGLFFQYQQKNQYLLDLNPYVGYKLTGRFTAGFGWNHRLAWDSKLKTWNQRSRIFGPRAYVDFKLGKGFIAHLEGESMNTFVPSTLLGNPDTGQREWVWSCMTGLKKEYRIYKNLKGTALIQYNLFNRFYKAPYVDRFNSRVGFEYTLKKRKREKG